MKKTLGIAKNKTLKIVAITAMTIFSLFVCITGAFAWFVGNLKENANATLMEVESTSGILVSVSTHRLVRNASTDNQYAFSTTPVQNEMVIDWPSGTPSAYVSTELDRYNPLEVHNPVLVLFTFKDNVPDWQISINAQSTSSEFVGYITDKDDNPLSSVVEFRSIGFSTTPTISNNNYIISTSALSASTHFVNITTDEAGYPTVDPNNGFVASQTFYQGSGNSTTKYVGIILDYYEPAMSYLFAVNLGNPLFEMDMSDEDVGVINFNCDWSMTI